MAAKPSNKHILTYTFTALAGLMLLAGVLQAKESRLPPGRFQLGVNGDQYDLVANEANMYEVMEALRDLSGLDFILDEKLRDETVSVRFDQLGLEPLLEQLAESRALVYEREGDTVKLVGAVVTSQQEAPEAADSPDEDEPVRSASASRLTGPPDAYGMLSNTTRPLAELLRRDGPPAILMANGIIDTSLSDPAARSLPIPDGYRARKDTEYFIVQFDDRITPGERSQVEELGGRIGHYVPRNALAVQAGPDVREALGQAKNVIHVEPFHPYFKMSRDLVDYFTGNRSEQAREHVEKGRYNVLMFRDVAGKDLLSAPDVEIVSVQASADREMLTVSCDPDRVSDLLYTEGVQWVEPAVDPKAMNDLAEVTTTASVFKKRHPTLDGSGVIVAVTDSGVDVTHRGFSVDPDLPTDLGSNSRILYYEARPGPTSDGIQGDMNGHGTHVSGSILGNGALSDTANLVPGSGDPPYSAQKFAGMAPEANLVMIEDFNSFTQVDQAQTAYEQGARLSNNSWGFPGAHEYGAMSAIWDGLVRDADQLTAGNQEYIVFYAAGNEGAGAADGTGGTAGTVSQPGNAKNVITVGAVEQIRHANNIPNAELETDTDWQVANFSSRGPITSTDPRVKPDIVAPGVYVISAQSKDRDYDSFYDPLAPLVDDLRNNNVDTGTNYAFLSGTSMACPVATGIGALIYEYFTERLDHVPSPALVKAVMVGGSRHLNSFLYNYPSFGNEPTIVHEGWGMVDVVRSVDGPQVNPGSSPIFLDQSDTSPVGSDETYTFPVTINEGDGGLKVTLAWTDVPGNPDVNPKLVNDIDLLVRTPDGTSGYVGNYFDSAGLQSEFWENPNLTFGDDFNNVELVIIPDAVPGTYTVEVFGWDVPAGPQDFALVITKGEGLQGRTEGRQPAMVLDDLDQAVVAYVEEDDGGFTQIFLKRWLGPVPSDLGPLGEWARMEGQWFGVAGSTRNTGISQTVAPSVNPAVAVSDDDLFVAWEQESNDTNFPTSIYFRMYDASTEQWIELGNSGRQQGISTNFSFNALMPAVARMLDGRPVVAYRQNTAGTAVIKVARWNGVEWAGLGSSYSTGVSGSTSSTDPDITVDGFGRVVVTWTEFTASGKRIRVRRWNGSTWESLGDRGKTPNAQQSSVAIGPNDDIYVSYQQFPNYTAGQLLVQVYLERYNGSSWGGIAGSSSYPGISNSTNLNGSTTPVYPDMDVNQSGVIMAAWQQSEGLASNAIIVVGYQPGGDWEGVAGAGEWPGVDQLIGVSQFANVGVDAAGLPITVFQDNSDGPQEILGYTVVSDRVPPFFAGLGRAEGSTNNNVNLSWLPAADATGPITYHVFQSTVPFDCGDDPNCDPEDIFANEIATTTNLSYQVMGLQAGKVYCFAVRASDGAGNTDDNEVIRSAGPVTGSGDLDGDCLDNLLELAAGTEVCVKDTDGDGSWDGWEWTFSTNNPAHPNALAMDPLDNGSDNVGTLEPDDGDPSQAPDADLDGDGASNYEEFLWWLDNTGASCNIAATASDPTDPDTDGDGIFDGWEIINGLDPTDPSDAGDDPDGDNLDNLGEFENGGDPQNRDTDGDGLIDGREANFFKTRVDLADSDRDGLDDGYELITTLSDPRDADDNDDLVSDGDAYQLGLDPTDTGAPALNILMCEDFETSSRDAWTTGAPNPVAPFNLWHVSTADPDPRAYAALELDDRTTDTSYRVANDPSGSDTNATYNFFNSLIICELVSPVIDASTVTNLSLTWIEYVDTEADQDQTRVFARGGEDPNWVPVSAAASGQSGGWVRRTVDISGFAGLPDVQVRFLFQTSSGQNNLFGGWYVDDVCVYEATTIYGWVRDVNGASVEGAVVLAMGSGGVTNIVNGHTFIRPGKVMGQALSADDGTFTIRSLPRGSYYVKADGPSHIAEFFNGPLFTPPYAFGAELDPGVPSRDDVTSGGLVNQTTHGIASEADFELGPGNGRSCLGVSAIGTFPVFLNSLATEIWNGDNTTGGAAFVAYETDPASGLENLEPDWETNPVAPELLCDIDAGAQRPYAMDTGVLYPRPEVETREGETSRIIINTDQGEGRLFVRAEDGGAYPVWVDGNDSGEETPVTLAIKAGNHTVQIWPTNGLWVGQQETTVPFGNRSTVTFTEDELLAQPGSLVVRAVDIFQATVTDAVVYVDGVMIDFEHILIGETPGTPTTVMDLQPGAHAVTVWKAGYKQPGYRSIRIAEGQTIETVFVLFQADEDYDRVGDSTEVAGYTNVFMFSRSDDPDLDTLSNLQEFEQFRRYGIRLNVFNPDTDVDGMTDGEELAYDDLPGVLALSRLFTNAILQASTAQVEFVGEYLGGFDHFDDGTLWPAIECDRFDAAGISQSQPLVPTIIGAATIFDGIPNTNENRRISSGHPIGAQVLADTLPDTVDTDGDGMWDGFEFMYGLGTVAMLDPIDCGRAFEDPDGDGLTNLDEFLGPDGEANTNDFLNPTDPDTDGDQMPDGWEISFGLDPLDLLDQFEDPDGDGVLNVGEYFFGSNPQLADSDGDFLPDGAEATYGSNPNAVDTDLDGLLDGREVWDKDLDGVFDGGFFNVVPGGDLDGDGFADGPQDWDTDGDGMPDGFEVLDAWGELLVPLNQDCVLDPYNNQDADRDCDGDGLSNLQEFLIKDALYGNHPSEFSPLFVDVVWDLTTNPFNPDTDGDGLPDGWEADNGMHPFDPIPNQGGGTSLRYGSLNTGGDLDGDGLWNLREFNIRFDLSPSADLYAIDDMSTDPWDVDTDDDGLEDGEEDRAHRTHPLNQDTDGDRLLDGTSLPDIYGEVESLLRTNTAVVDATNNTDQAMNDLWMLTWPGSWPLPYWTRVEPSGDLPPPRWGAAVSYNPVYETDPAGGVGDNVNLEMDNRQLVVIGGQDGVSRHVDIWQYKISENVWVKSLVTLTNFFDLVMDEQGELIEVIGPGLPSGLSELFSFPIFGWRNDGPDRPQGQNGSQTYDFHYIYGGWDDAHTYYGTEFDSLYKSTDNQSPIGTTIITDQDVWERRPPRPHMNLENVNTAGGRVYLPIGDYTTEFEGFEGNYTGIHFSEVPTNDVSTNIQVFLVLDVAVGPTSDLPVTIYAEFSTETGASPLYEVDVSPPPNPPSARLMFPFTNASLNVVIPADFEGEYQVEVTDPVIQLLTNEAFTGTAIGFVIEAELGSDSALLEENETKLIFGTLPEYLINGFFDGFSSLTAQNTSFTALLRKSSPMAFDYEREIAIMFGGISGNDVKGDTLEGTFTWANRNNGFGPQNATWAEINVTNGPSARYGHAMVYDAANDRAVMFGGFDALHRPLNDLWVYSAVNNTWTELTAFADSQRPMPRGGAMMVYLGDWDYNRNVSYQLESSGGNWNKQKVVLFGGTDGTTYFNDTWVLDEGGTNRWILSNPAGEQSQGPPPRAFGQMVYAQNGLLPTVFDENFNEILVPDAEGLSTYHSTTPVDGADPAVFLFGGRTGTLPTGTDTDGDRIDDGTEYELARDPRVNALVVTNHPTETVPFAYKRIGTYGGGLFADGVATIADFEVLSSEDRVGASFQDLAWQGHWVDGSDVGDPGPNIGVDAFLSQYTNLWWHQFGGEDPFDPRDVWQLGKPDNAAIGLSGAPPYAHSGRWCYSTSRNGNYPSDARMELYSPVFDLVASTSYLVDTDVWETVDMQILDQVIVDGQAALPLGGYVDTNLFTTGYYAAIHFPAPPVADEGSKVSLLLNILEPPAEDLILDLFVEFDESLGHSPTDYSFGTGAPPSARLESPFVVEPVTFVIPAGTVRTLSIDITVAYLAITGNPSFDGTSVGVVIRDPFEGEVFALAQADQAQLIVSDGKSLRDGQGPFYLEFYEWLDLEDANDSVLVELVRPKTPSETQIRESNPSYPPQIVLPARNSAYNTTGDWRRVVVPLDLFMGETNVYLRFTLQSDAAGVAGGWYVDDVAIYQAGSITGLLTEAGAPAGTEPIFLLGDNINQNILDTSLSDQDGSYQFGPLPLGSYKLWAGDSLIDVTLSESEPVAGVGLETSLSAAILEISGTGPVDITWAAVPGMSYRIDYTDGLTPEPALWTPLATVAATGVVETYTDTSPTMGVRIYRVVLVLP